MKIGFQIIWTWKVLEDTVYCLCVCRHNKAIFMHSPGRRPVVTALWVWLQLFHYREYSRTVHPFSVRLASGGNVCCFYLTNLLYKSPPWLHFNSPQAIDPNHSCQKSQLNSKPNPEHYKTQETLRVCERKQVCDNFSTFVIICNVGIYAYILTICAST